MPDYIIVKEPAEQFDFKGRSLGIAPKTGVFYSSATGRKKYFRMCFLNPPKGFRLLTFKRKKRAQDVCNRTNEVSGCGGFKVEELVVKKKYT